MNCPPEVRLLPLLAALSLSLVAGTGCGTWGESPLEDCGAAADADTLETPGKAELATTRLNCYRELMGVPSVALDSRLSAAAEAHAAYLHSHGGLGHTEAPSLEGYTGANPSQRAIAAGYPHDPGVGSIAEVVAFRDGGIDPEFAVDHWMGTVYHRAPLTVPLQEAVGYGQVGIFSVLLVATPWETSSNAADYELAVYPVPEQPGIPQLFDSDREFPDPAPQVGEVGYPISISFLADDYQSDENLYGLFVDAEATWLRDDRGRDVPVAILEPHSDVNLNRSVFLLADSPLRPHSSYTARISGSVAGQPFDEAWTFTTAQSE